MRIVQREASWIIWKRSF